MYLYLMIAEKVNYAFIDVKETESYYPQVPYLSYNVSMRGATRHKRPQAFWAGMPLTYSEVIAKWIRSNIASFNDGCQEKAGGGATKFGP